MTTEPSEDEEIQLGSTMTPRQVRILRIVVKAMGLMLVLGFGLVVGTIVYQASQLGKTENDAKPEMVVVRSGSLMPDVTVPISRGSAVISMTLDGSRLAVHLKSPAGDEIAIVDLASGKVVSRVKLKAE